MIGSGTFACLRQTGGGRSRGFQSTAVAVHGPVSTSCACPCVCTLPHVSPVRAPENRKMNRSKNQCSTTTEIQSRVERVCQESKRTTTTTEPESDESLVSTVKNSTLAREAALGPIEEQSNSPLGVQQCSSGSVRNCSAANDWPPTMAEMLKKEVLSMLNPSLLPSAPPPLDQTAEEGQRNPPLRGARLSPLQTRRESV